MPTAVLPTVAAVRDTAVSRGSAATGARILHALMLGKLSHQHWKSVFEARWERDTHAEKVRAFSVGDRRAAVPGMTTGDALALIPETFVGAFAESLRPATVLGQMTGASPAPFYVRLVTAISGATAYWVGEGHAKPLTQAIYGAQSALARRKVVALAVVTEEMLKAPGLDAEALVRRELENAMIQMTDVALLDPSNAGSEARPASITNACVAIPSSGIDAASFDADIAAAVGSLVNAGVPLRSPRLITSTAVALHLSTLRDPGGARAFPGVTLTGGEIAGTPLIVSATCGPQIVALDESFLLVARDAMDARALRDGDVEMTDAPLADAGGPTGASSLVNLWQVNSVGLLMEQPLNWTMARPEAVARVADIALPVTP